MADLFSARYNTILHMLNIWNVLCVDKRVIRNQFRRCNFYCFSSLTLMILKLKKQISALSMCAPLLTRNLVCHKFA